MLLLLSKMASSLGYGSSVSKCISSVSSSSMSWAGLALEEFTAFAAGALKRICFCS